MHDRAATVAGDELGGDFDQVRPDADELADERLDHARTVGISEHDDDVADGRVFFDLDHHVHRLRVGEQREAEDVVPDGGRGLADPDRRLVEQRELHARMPGDDVLVGEDKFLLSKCTCKRTARTALVLHEEEAAGVILHEFRDLLIRRRRTHARGRNARCKREERGGESGEDAFHFGNS